jgi:hypothetical protein
MATVYVQARPKGSQQGASVDDFVVENEVDRVLGIFSTQREAVEWAKRHDHRPHLARVRHLNDKTKPEHWSAA